MFTLRKLTLTLALTGQLSTPVLAETTVLASLPITFGLSELLLKDSGVTSVLIGASSPEQIVQNLGILNAPAFTTDELARIDAITGAAI